MAGAGDDGLLNQFLLVVTITQTFLGFVRVVTQLVEHVIRAQEAAQIGERRIAFDQVFLRVGGELAGGQLEAGQVYRVDRLLTQVRCQLRIERNDGGVARLAGVGFCAAAHVGVATAHDGVVDAVFGLNVDCAARLNDGGVALVRCCQLGSFREVGLFAFSATDEGGKRGFKTAQIIFVVTGAVD